MRANYQKAAAKKAEALRVREIGEGDDVGEPSLPLKRNQRVKPDPHALVNYARTVVLRRLGVTVYRRENNFLMDGRTLSPLTFYREGRYRLEAVAKKRGISDVELAAMVKQVKGWREAFPITRVQRGPRAPRPRHG